MKYSEIENIHSVIHRARDIATHAEVSFWFRDEKDKDWHVNHAFETLAKLADVFGCDLVKREVAND